MADAVQPNFGAISQSSNALSTQFGHFQNLPSVREGNQILDAINGFRDDMNRRFTEVTNRLDGIDNRLDGMDNRLNGMDTRFMATFAHSSLLICIKR
jgi:archaellum component FlaC